MKNKMEDLHNHLFEQLERLNDEDLQGEELETELKRAKAITGISSQIVQNAAVALNAAKLKADYETGKLILPVLLEAGKDD